MTATAQPSARVAAQAAAAAAPLQAPGRPEPKRPPLRVVEPGERQPRRQREPKHRRRLLATSVVLFAALLLFGLVAAHVLLTQNQFRLQRVQRQAAEEQARYERLRAEVAELESPGRVVKAAQERLGMVPPNSVKYLTPAGAATPPPPSAAEQAQGAEDEQAATDWSVVKQRLSSRP